MQLSASFRNSCSMKRTDPQIRIYNWVRADHISPHSFCCKWEKWVCHSKWITQTFLVWSPNWPLHDAYQTAALHNWKSLKYKRTVNLISSHCGTSTGVDSWTPTCLWIHFERCAVLWLDSFFCAWPRNYNLSINYSPTTHTDTPHSSLSTAPLQEVWPGYTAFKQVAAISYKNKNKNDINKL